MKSGKEKHYKQVLNTVRDLGPNGSKMGNTIAWAYYDDPRHLVFTLARYKFAAKMMRNRKSVIEIGCGDGFASRILLQEAEALTGIDVDDEQISDAKSRHIEQWPIDFRVHDILVDGPVSGSYDGAVSLDVLEHIPTDKHDLFLKNITASLGEDAIAVIGMPSLESQKWASPQSILGHVACLNQADLAETMERHFKTVLLFSMNDEVVHTGFHAMSHYNIAVGVSPKNPSNH